MRLLPLFALLFACTPEKPGGEEDCLNAPPWYDDADGDGFGDPMTQGLGCAPATGTADNGDDCSDTDATRNPGAGERCNDIDDDCDGEIDEGADDGVTWYTDADSDGYGDAALPIDACQQPAGAVANATDCDDTLADVHPGAYELCNGADEDCDGVPDDDPLDGVSGWVDLDGDGYGTGDAVMACQGAGYAPAGGDCDDLEPDVHPTAGESCDDLDNDCDGIIDTIYLVPDYFDSLAEAVEAAPEGALVCVGAGTWNERLVITKAITVEGVGSDLTIVDGSGGASPVAEISDTTTGAKLSGLTITGGDGTNGAGLRVTEARADLVDVRLTGNQCASGGCKGSGLYLQGATVTARGLVVDGNTQTCTGSQSCAGVAIYASGSTLDVVDGEIFGNAATTSTTARGGALYVTDGSTARWRDGAWYANTLVGTSGSAFAEGAGAFVEDGGLLEGFNLLVADSSSGGDGTCSGALMVYGDANFTNVALTGNEAVCDDATGGGVVIAASTAAVTFTNSDIVYNVASGEGGAAFFVSTRGDLDLVNTNVSGNFANSGDAVHGRYYTQLSATYCNFWENGNEPFVGVDEPSLADGNVTHDPMHADTSATLSVDWDLRLDAASRLRDAGDPGISDSDGSRSDIGAYGGPGGADW